MSLIKEWLVDILGHTITSEEDLESPFEKAVLYTTSIGTVILIRDPDTTSGKIVSFLKNNTADILVLLVKATQTRVSRNIETEARVEVFPIDQVVWPWKILKKIDAKLYRKDTVQAKQAHTDTTVLTSDPLARSLMADPGDVISISNDDDVRFSVVRDRHA